MDLTIQQGDLAFAVARALGSVPQKSAQPLLNCLLLEADQKSLRITGSDLDLTTSVPTVLAEPVGEPLVQRRSLPLRDGVVGGLPDQHVPERERLTPTAPQAFQQALAGQGRPPVFGVGGGEVLVQRLEARQGQPAEAEESGRAGGEALEGDHMRSLPQK